MTQTSNLMGAGTPSLQARAIVGGSSLGNTATGTTQADAFLLQTTNVTFTTVASGSGAVLTALAQTGDYYKIYNLGANALLVYPPVGAGIGTGAANASISVPVNKSVMMTNLSPTLWGMNLSA